MAIQSLLNNGVFEVINTGAAAGTTAVNSDSIDMNGYDSAVFVALWGAIVANGVQSMNVAQSDDDSTFTDLAGTSVAVADDDDDKISIVEIARHTGSRYLRAEIARATQNSTIDGIWSYKYNADTVPTTQDATVAGSELHVSPATGTA